MPATKVKIDHRSNHHRIFKNGHVRTDMNMKKIARGLIFHLNEMGFDGYNQYAQIMNAGMAGLKAFTLREMRPTSSGMLELDIHICQGAEQQGYYLDSYRATLVKPYEPLPAIIAGIDIVDLVGQMEKVDWSKDHSAAFERYFLGRPSGVAGMDNILSTLFQLGADEDSTGHRARQQLIHQYLLGTGFDWFIDTASVRNAFEISQFFSGQGARLPTVMEAFEQLQQSAMRPVVQQRARHVPRRQGPSKGMHP